MRLRTPKTRAALALLAGACNSRPVLDPIDPQQAMVNTPLVVELSAGDRDGDPLTFSFSADLPNIETRAQILPTEDGALFQWTPLISDVGTHRFAFSASDGRAVGEQPVDIAVTVDERANAPVFIQPLGTGGTLDLTQASCLDVPVEVVDSDSVELTLSQMQPIEGASLEGEGGKATWSFCPSRQQIATDDRYALRLSASDGEQITLKDYLIVLRGDDGADCPGKAPEIVHSARDWSTIADLGITVTVRDDQGLKFDPLLYYSLEPPSDPPNPSRMIQLSMALSSGDRRDGEWTAIVPNPAVGLPEGETAELYYLVVATDNDDPAGPCDHTRQAPDQGAWRATVENPGGDGTLAFCDSCTADLQCAGSDSACFWFGDTPRCLSACSRDQDCGPDQYCSFGEFESLGGERGRQCLPLLLTCEEPDTGCVDDLFEDNDQPYDAVYLSAGEWSLTSCSDPETGDDEDWFLVDLSREGELEASLRGGDETDLDLDLYTGGGILLDQDDDLSSRARVSACVEPGTYLLRVHSYGTGENDYDLEYSHTSLGCASICEPDPAEPDDLPSLASPVDLDSAPWRRRDRTICEDGDDWYEVQMFAGEELYATLEFVQSRPNEDLDLLLFDEDGNNLSGCDETAPRLCDPSNGQSADSDEWMGWALYSTGTYYVVVHGWGGSKNTYDLCIGLEVDQCP